MTWLKIFFRKTASKIDGGLFNRRNGGGLVSSTSKSFQSVTKANCSLRYSSSSSGVPLGSSAAPTVSSENDALMEHSSGYGEHYNQVTTLNYLLTHSLRIPTDMTKDLFVQLGMGDNYFSFDHDSDCLYPVPRETEPDRDYKHVTRVLTDVNPSFKFKLRMSFLLRILTTMFDDKFGYEVDTGQNLAKEAYEQLMENRPNWKILFDYIQKSYKSEVTKMDTMSAVDSLLDFTKKNFYNHSGLSADTIANLIAVYLDTYAPASSYQYIIDDKPLLGIAPAPSVYLMHIANSVTLRDGCDDSADPHIHVRRSRDFLSYSLCLLNIITQPQLELSTRRRLHEQISWTWRHFVASDASHYSINHYHRALDYFTNSSLPLLANFDRSGDMIYSVLIADIEELFLRKSIKHKDFDYFKI